MTPNLGKIFKINIDPQETLSIQAIVKLSFPLISRCRFKPKLDRFVLASLRDFYSDLTNIVSYGVNENLTFRGDPLDVLTLKRWFRAVGFKEANDLESLEFESSQIAKITFISDIGMMDCLEVYLTLYQKRLITPDGGRIGRGGHLRPAEIMRVLSQGGDFGIESDIAPDIPHGNN